MGGLLFAAAAATPFAVDAVTFVLGAALLATMSGAFRAGPVAGFRPTLRADMREGLSWLWRHRLLRTVSVERLVSRSEGSYGRKFALPSSGRVNPSASTYSTRTFATTGRPSDCKAMGKFGTSRSLPGATLPCQPASTYV